MTQEEFTAEVEAFLRKHRLTATAFGVAALNDPSFVFQLRQGRRPNLETADKVRAYMRQHAKTAAA